MSKHVYHGIAESIQICEESGRITRWSHDEKEDYTEAEKKHKHETREALTPFLKRVFVGWLITAMMLFIINSFKFIHQYFYIPDMVMMSLLGTTTANVIGLFAILAKYYYANEKIRSE